MAGDCAEDYADSGFRQFDTHQDAPYFGVWVNPRTRQTLTYCEGDWSLAECPDDAAYNAEIRAMSEFYEPGFIAVAVGNDGQATRYEQDRSTFLIPPSPETAETPA